MEDASSSRGVGGMEDLEGREGGALRGQKFELTEEQRSSNLKLRVANKGG